MNQNMIKMYQAQGEFEQSLNSIGQRQNELIKQHIRTQEWYLFDKNGGGSTGKPEPSLPEFTPFNASYKYEPVNLKDKFKLLILLMRKLKKVGITRL